VVASTSLNKCQHFTEIAIPTKFIWLPALSQISASTFDGISIDLLERCPYGITIDMKQHLSRLKKPLNIPEGRTWALLRNARALRGKVKIKGENLSKIKGLSQRHSLHTVLARYG